MSGRLLMAENSCGLGLSLTRSNDGNVFLKLIILFCLMNSHLLLLLFNSSKLHMNETIPPLSISIYYDVEIYLLNISTCMNFPNKNRLSIRFPTALSMDHRRVSVSK